MVDYMLKGLPRSTQPFQVQLMLGAIILDSAILKHMHLTYSMSRLRLVSLKAG